MNLIVIFAALAVAILANGAERRISLLAPSDTKSVRLAADAFADVWEKVTEHGGWTSPFDVHWRQIGWDMGIKNYSETGFYDTQVMRDILDR